MTAAAFIDAHRGALCLALDAARARALANKGAAKRFGREYVPVFDAQVQTLEMVFHDLINVLEEA